MNTINVAIADDHQLFREGLFTILSLYPNIEIIIEASNGVELLQEIDKQQPDVVLLDLKMPKMDGLAAAEHIKSKYPQVKIIILTMHHQEDFILHLLKLGVNAYLFKNAAASEVKQAIEAVVEHDYFFDSSISQIMLKGLRKKHIAKPKLDGSIRLTPREEEVLNLICREYTAGEIADKLFISPRTVETHRKNLFEKFGVNNTVGLVVKAIEFNLFKVG